MPFAAKDNEFVYRRQPARRKHTGRYMPAAKFANTYMKKTCQIFAVLGLTITITVVIQNKNIPSHKTFYTSNDNSVEARKELIPGSCTIFSVSYDGFVFMGNNEDWKNPSTYYWVNPAKEGEYGVLYFGYDDFGPQGGVNEKGLAFDGNALPYIPIKSHPEKRQASEAIVNHIIMKKCATVEEAIAMATSYDWGNLYSRKFAGQYLLADPTGDAVVIGFDSDGELAFTRKARGDGYLVSTNFNRAYPANRYGTYPCQRFEKASSILKSINQGEDCTVAYLASILDAVHEEGRTLNTLYSNIYDLKNGIVYLYYWHNFSYVCKLNVGEIIKSAQPPKPIKDLFPQEVTEKALEEHQKYKNDHLRILLIVGWICLVIGSEILLFRGKFMYTVASGKNRKIWILIVLLIGPFGLLFLVVKKKTR